MLRKKRNQANLGALPSVDWLVVGLGNPGSRYAQTRHNIGRIVADEFTSLISNPSQVQGASFVATCGAVDGVGVAIVTPSLYMNESGRAVAEAQRLFSVSAAHTLVILDEYNFPVGKVHVKAGGGSGGHNGTQSVIEETETRDFVRMRCGIDRKFGPGELVDYVLAPFDTREADGVQAMLQQSILALRHILKTPFGTATSDINSGKLFATSVDNSN